jgi:hypothetical protein
MASKYLEAMKSHFKALGTPSIEIPEWVVDGKPMKIFWKPLTLVERAEIFEGDGTDLEIFIRKALDADGNRMFNLEDKQSIRVAVAPQIVQRIAVEMMKLPSVEQVEKN